MITISRFSPPESDDALLRAAKQVHIHPKFKPLRGRAGRVKVFTKLEIQAFELVKLWKEKGEKL